MRAASIETVEPEALQESVPAQPVRKRLEAFDEQATLLAISPEIGVEAEVRHRSPESGKRPQLVDIDELGSSSGKCRLLAAGPDGDLACFRARAGASAAGAAAATGAVRGATGDGF